MAKNILKGILYIVSAMIAFMLTLWIIFSQVDYYFATRVVYISFEYGFTAYVVTTLMMLYCCLYTVVASIVNSHSCFLKATNKIRGI